ncbi:MAG TPA: Mur ligase family protein, partial [Acidimicrobiales bacterium]|nr:Mur ligase family protein [Acidimicrobiales bacterium]
MTEAAALLVDPAAVVHVSRFGSAASWVAVGLCVGATGVAGLRWLRVAQREHYLAGSCLRFARRWWLGDLPSTMLAAAALGAAVATWWWPLAAVVTAAAVTAGPIGLGVRGRTSALAWTRRLRTLAATWGVVTTVVLVGGWLLGVAPVAAAAVCLLVPLLVDAACALTAPLEDLLADRHVRLAATRLSSVSPAVVAITGSFGKTSTKWHVAQLVGSSRSLVATPASFNNRAGLARAVNENLADGTEVFVAEMGTYGVGEIAELCRWCPPDVAVITAVGPVHLERFGSEERILEAKSEILERATTAVLAVDDDRLAALADRQRAAGQLVLRSSTSDRTADVCVARTDTDGSASLTVYVRGEPLAKDVPAPIGVQPSNLACAVAVAVALGVDSRVLAANLADVHVADHRLSVAPAPSGVMVVDDTYNANPSGAEAALDALEAAVAAPDGVASTAETGHAGEAGTEGHRVAVVTPGMVE